MLLLPLLTYDTPGTSNQSHPDGEPCIRYYIGQTIISIYFVFIFSCRLNRVIRF